MKPTTMNFLCQINGQIDVSLIVFHLNLLVYFNVALNTAFPAAIIIERH